MVLIALLERSAGIAFGQTLSFCGCKRDKGTVETTKIWRPKTGCPDIPPHIEKCIRVGLSAADGQHKQPNQSKAKSKSEEKTKDSGAQTAQGQGKSLSADELVLARLKSDEERRKCARAVLEWYRSLQAAQKEKVAQK